MKYCKVYKNGKQSKFKEARGRPIITVEDVMSFIIDNEASYHKYNWVIIGECPAKCDKCGCQTDKSEKLKIEVSGDQLREKDELAQSAHETKTEKKRKALVKKLKISDRISHFLVYFAENRLDCSFLDADFSSHDPSVTVHQDGEFALYTWWENFSTIEIMSIDKLLKVLTDRVQYPDKAKRVELFDVDELKELIFTIEGLDIR